MCSQMVKNKSCSLVLVNSEIVLKIQYFNLTTDHQLWKKYIEEKYNVLST